MAAISIAYGLPFVDVIVRVKGHSLGISHVLLDTGSAKTVFRGDVLEEIGVKADLQDIIVQMIGIGGAESVVEKQIEAVEIGDLVLSPMVIQLGGLNYGFPINGILGLDFLLQTGAQINFSTLEIGKA